MDVGECVWEPAGQKVRCPHCKAERDSPRRRNCVKPPPNPPETPPGRVCVHRGPTVDSAPCKPCRNAGKREATIYSCLHYGRVTDGVVIEDGAHLHHCGVACDLHEELKPSRVD